MIRVLLITLGLGDFAGLAGVVHYLAHHRTGILTAILTAGSWGAHRIKRRFVHTGKRVARKALV